MEPGQIWVGPLETAYQYKALDDWNSSLRLCIARMNLCILRERCYTVIYPIA